MAVIDVGAEAINRASNTAFGNYTIITLCNPANLSGLISSLEVWPYSTLSGANKIGFFYLVSGTTYKCRSAASLASIASGSKQTVTKDSSGTDLSLSISSADLIGFYFPTGAMEQADTGSGYYWRSGDHCVVDDSGSYTLAANHDLSVKGLGAEVGGGTNLVKMVLGE